jgi:cobaltochelatase CobS
MSLFEQAEKELELRMSSLISEKVTEALKNVKASAPKSIILKEKGKPDKPLTGLHHKSFTDVLMAVKAKQNVLLTGQTASGKTFMVKQVADALGLDFYFDGSLQQKYELLGARDLNGVVRSNFYKAFKFGGLYLADEVDSWVAKVFLSINAALSNKYQGFPDGIVEMHEDFRFVATANTWGKGATRDYVGRNSLDAASLARFNAQFYIDYDEELELAFADNPEYSSYVIKVRKAVEELGIRKIIQPRMGNAGAALLNVGMNRTKTEKATIWQDMTDSDISKVKAKMKKLAESTATKPNEEDVPLS